MTGMLHTRLPTPVSLLFHRPVGSLMPKYSRLPILFEQSDDYYDALIKRQHNPNINKDTDKGSLST